MQATSVFLILTMCSACFSGLVFFFLGRRGWSSACTSSVILTHPVVLFFSAQAICTLVSSLATAQGMSGIDVRAVTYELCGKLPLWIDKIYQFETRTVGIRLNG